MEKIQKGLIYTIFLIYFKYQMNIKKELDSLIVRETILLDK